MNKYVLQLNKFRFFIGKDLSPEINISLPYKSFALVTGNNGEGKSLFFKSLVGENAISCGEILHNNLKVKKVEEVPIAYCPVNSFDDYSMTTRELVELILIQTPVEKKIGLRPLIKLLEIDKLFQVEVKKLSAGEKKRLSFLIVEAQDAEIYLYDEPEANLDQGFRKKVVSYLTNKSLDKTILAVTHYPELYKNFYDQKMVVNRSEIAVTKEANTRTSENMSENK